MRPEKNRPYMTDGGTEILRLISEHMRGFSEYDHAVHAHAQIDVYFSRARFALDKLIRFAPTGVVEPPIVVQAGRNTFYYYGTGGGGVSYPDNYFYNLHGRTLQIMFDGPYNGRSKSPDDETQATEKLMLTSFEEF